MTEQTSTKPNLQLICPHCGEQIESVLQDESETVEYSYNAESNTVSRIGTVAYEASPGFRCSLCYEDIDLPPDLQYS